MGEYNNARKKPVKIQHQLLKVKTQQQLSNVKTAQVAL